MPEYKPLNNTGLKLQEIADPEVIGHFTGLRASLAEIASKLKGFNIPSIFPVKGNVSIDNTPGVYVENLSDLSAHFKSLEGQLRAFTVAAASAKAQPINFPKIEFPKSEAMKFDVEPLIAEVKKLDESIKKIKLGEIDFPATIAVSNFPPQKIPQPVTHISINALQGSVLTTDVSVGVSATLLPPTNLDNRRSLIVYNNSANIIYLGGSNVTTSNGLPLPAASYSPSFDLGKNSFLYAVSTAPSDVRVIEISDEASGR